MNLIISFFLSISFAQAQEISSADSLNNELVQARIISNRAKKQNRLVKIAIVDTGLDRDDPRFSDVLCKDGHKNFTNNSIETKDTNGHGTHVAGLIKKHAGKKGYCLIILKYYEDNADGHKNFTNSIKALEWAVSLNVDIVNFSGGGPTPDVLERKVINSAKKTLFVVAAGNRSVNMTTSGNKFYPASYELPNIIVIGNLSQNGITRSPTSNYGDPRIIWEVGENLNSTMPCLNNKIGYNCEGEMTGTSQATAVHTGRLVEKIINE